MQLKLFNKTDSEEITNEWLLSYLQINYPEMLFQEKEHLGGKVIESVLHRKITFSIKIVIKDEETLWCRKFDKYISICLYKNFGDWRGYGRGIDTIDEFKQIINEFVIRAKEYVNEYKNICSR